MKREQRSTVLRDTNNCLFAERSARGAKRYPARSSEILSLGFQLSGKLAFSRLAGVNDARERVLKLLRIGRGSGRG